MEFISDDQSVVMEEINPPTITDEQRCNNLKSIEKQIRIFAARKDYVSEMLDIEKSSPGPTTETIQKLEADAASLDEKIKDLEGNMLELLPCPVPLCAHNFKFNKNNKKRSAEPIIRPSKLTTKINKNSNMDVKTLKSRGKRLKAITFQRRIQKLPRPTTSLQSSTLQTTTSRMSPQLHQKLNP
ncbi:uncharacterized protein TNIN_262801 [Trichonephila inaurata madagascariensis]|uniref:Uncharacterized protein n=1 Tax=Trichonephila inaurata madagascariensis TaxID=2747483 RepID=A0A8X6X0G5_9ARAC|nr:uncharacterized protein TNIN_262801 [Trichonephila inaurata madagascariensis]